MANYKLEHDLNPKLRYILHINDPKIQHTNPLVGYSYDELFFKFDELFGTRKKETVVLRCTIVSTPESMQLWLQSQEGSDRKDSTPTPPFLPPSYRTTTPKRIISRKNWSGSRFTALCAGLRKLFGMNSSRMTQHDASSESLTCKVCHFTNLLTKKFSQGLMNTLPTLTA